MITYQSPSRKCKFLFPILDDVDLLIDYNGLFWRPEESLSNFSDACTGFLLDTFESNGNKFIVITTKDFTIDEHIEIIFESRLVEDFPCAFYDENSKKYDDLSITTEAQGISLSVDSNDHMVVTTIDYLDETTIDYDDEDDGDGVWADPEEEYPEPIPIPQTKPEPIPVITAPQLENTAIQDLQNRLEKAMSDCEVLHNENDKLKAEIDRLSIKLKNSSTLITPKDIDEEAKAEIERLRTLISQLVDKDFSGEFIKTLDDQINELTKKINEQRKTAKEKNTSLSLLESEYKEAEEKTKEITRQISKTMKLLHKAESIQRESTTELSVFQKRLNDILNELQIDISTLEMYETQDGVDTLILEATDMTKKIESKLKALISSRQKDNNNRFNNVTS